MSHAPPEVGTVLAALAELAPAGGERVLDVTRGGTPLAWLDDPERARRGRAVDRLAALDALHHDERILRRGWGFVVGTTEVDGARRRVRLPLLTQPVRLERGVRGYRVVPAGDLELTPLVADRNLAAVLESAPGLGGWGWLAHAGGGAVAWMRAAAEAAGLPVRDVDKTPGPPPEDGLKLLAAAGLFVVRDVLGAGLRDSLRSWAGRPGLADTALARAYGTAEPGAGDDAAESGAADDATVSGAADDATASGAADDAAEPGAGADVADAVLSPLPLNADQREVVRRTRTEPVVVVSGPPGNGKSHAVVAAALDVVDRDGSVLLATQSSHAADVLADLLERYPGPLPVLFGDAERRRAIAADLGQGTAAGHSGRVLRANRDAVAAAVATVDRLTDGIAAALEIERRAASVEHWESLVPGLAIDAPRAFEPGFDLTAATALADRAAERVAGRVDEPTPGWWRRWRRGAAERRLRRALGAPAGVPLDRLRTALEAGAARQAAARLAATGGTELGRAWSALGQADAALAAALGTAMRHRAASARRWSGAARRSAATLASALRAGRNRRREMLAGLDGQALVRALPLWIGTVADVEDLLPPVAGLFDLVILDEASHIDQIRAAPVLARARRALVVGDPRQLRFVSFVSDVGVAATLRRHGLDDRVDVRRISAFDLAAGAAPTTWLTEHYRSAPHLIEFSARRFYGDRISVATRHPANERVDAIEVLRVADGDVADGVNRPEVDRVLATVRELAGAGARGIGVVTPFRAQAEALESALLAAFSVDEIEALELRVGTVHAYQGSEADTVVASLAVTGTDAAARVRFAADPNLFNVMITRARLQMIVVTSLPPDGANGLIADYLEYSEHPPRPPAGGDGVGWAGALARELTRAGVRVRAQYPVGPWRVDLCVGEGVSAYGAICGVHAEGIAAHVERHRSLRRAGWRLVDAFPSRWGGDAARAALELNAAPR
jgi:hypothetical protein